MSKKDEPKKLGKNGVDMGRVVSTTSVILLMT